MFDHVLASPHFRVQDAGIEADWRAKGWSDHAGVWADLELA